MYGIDPITRQCIYKTPCGWCARLEKICKMDCKEKYDDCTYYRNGRCMGTKDMEACNGDKCKNFKFE